MALKFQVGDKIRVREGTNWGEMEGYTGVIQTASDNPSMWFPYGVTMDDLPASVAESCVKEGWFMEEDEMELVTNED